MIAAAAEEFATVEERFRYRYPFDESYKNLAVVVVEGEEGTGYHELRRSGQRAERTPSDILLGHNNIDDISIGDQDEQHLAQIRVFGVTVAKKTLVAE